MGKVAAASRRVIIGDQEYHLAQARARDVQYALEPLDRTAKEFEGRWGCERLLRLVSPATAAKVGAVQRRLDDAIAMNNAEGVARDAAIMQRAWQAMEDEALAAGHAPQPTGVWSIDWKGEAWTVVLDRADVDAVARAADNAACVVSLNELLLAYNEYRTRITDAVKATFAGAEVVAIRQTELGREIDDEIPF